MSTMAYSRVPYDARSPHESERSRTSWDTLQRPFYPSLASPSHHHIASPGILDPESESSDVSDNPGDDPHMRLQSAYPAALPPPPAKHILESPDAIHARLRELQQVEDHNIRKQEQLKVKRARKDDRIRRKREAQDVKIKAIMDARARRDERISRRRKVEDDAFERFDQDLELEETSLRRRLKRLKRGLPLDEITGSATRISSASISPPAPPHSSIPPPAKRHQSGHPGQNGSPVTSTPRPASHGIPSAPNSAGPNPPPYAFLQSGHAPSSTPYRNSPTFPNSPSAMTTNFPPMSRPPHSAPEPAHYGVNGHSASPHLSRPTIPSAGTPLNTAPPPRTASSSYDTRPPPPPAASGFATINAPPQATGFAAINPRNTATPPVPSRDIPLSKVADSNGINGTPRPYASEGTPASAPNSTTTKRTPSTTHPYQQSEAFANRHHHCERSDDLNRGIWTSHGSGGTKEIPTGPPVEMYLRCNHDGCRRIDWKTVHGLQCHIVKNHEQPKGTIGSLEKALDKYGVPVAEVEAYEREHGKGSGGTVSELKNPKPKSRMRDSLEKADGPRRSYGAQTPMGTYESNVAMSFGNPVQPFQGSHVPIRKLSHEGSADSGSEARTTPGNVSHRPDEQPHKFAAVNGVWSTTPNAKPVEPKDHEMKDAPPSSHPAAPVEPLKRDGSFWKMWPENGNNKDEPAPRQTIQAPVQVNGNHHPLGQTKSGFVVSEPPAPAPAPAPAIAEHPASKLQYIMHQEARPDANHEKAVLQADATPTAQPTQDGRESRTPAPVQENETSKVPETKPVSESTADQVPPKQSDTIVPQQQSEAQKEMPESQEAIRPEARSPELTTRRMSIVGSRRGSSRRSSLAARKAEEEREKEREEALAAAEAERQQKEKVKADGPPTNAEAEEVDGERSIENDNEDNKERDDDSDGSDMITVAVSRNAKDTKDKDKEGRETKTTPRRLANGRFVRKTR